MGIKQLIIIGASGHGRVVADIAHLNGYESIVFLDDDGSLKKCSKYSVVGVASEAVCIPGDVFIGIGNNTIRRCFCEMYVVHGSAYNFNPFGCCDCG